MVHLWVINGLYKGKHVLLVDAVNSWLIIVIVILREVG